MLIVLEGPDNSGKTTLAEFLSERLGIPIQHSGGPGKYPGEIYERIDRYNAESRTLIFDRHPAVSQNIHLIALGGSDEFIDAARLYRFYAKQPLIIYCRGLGTLEGHRPSEHADAEHDRAVETHYAALCHHYDQWAQQYAQIFYRIGDDMERIADIVYSLALRDLDQALDKMRRTDMFADIEAFHEKYGLAYDEAPRALDEELGHFREEFMDEELREYKHHAACARRELEVGHFGRRDNATLTHHLEGMLDALVDLTYVALGTAYLHGFDFQRAWQRVHAANMKKVRATRQVRGKRGESRFDVIKPEGWQPPRHGDLVARHAHLRDVKAG